MTGARDATTLNAFVEEPVPGRVTTRPAPACTHGPPRLIGIDTHMSTETTGARQRPRLIDAHLTVRDLPTLRDVDTADDAPALAAVAPNGRCAAAFRRMTKAATR